MYFVFLKEEKENSIHVMHKHCKLWFNYSGQLEKCCVGRREMKDLTNRSDAFEENQHYTKIILTNLNVEVKI